MKRQIKIDQLFKAAQPVPETTSETMPSHLKTRLLAHRHTMGATEEWFLPLALRRGLICAALIMMICIAWSSTELFSNPEDDLALANFELREDVLP